jgi:tRNA (Thr-GGU) A37 N-methylase
LSTPVRPYVITHKPTGEKIVVKNAPNAAQALRSVLEEYECEALSAAAALDLPHGTPVVDLAARRTQAAPPAASQPEPEPSPLQWARDSEGTPA